jgi:glycosyltransferase involved in cell wall biosynthesis
MKNYKISVIMATYNSAHYLPNSLDSLLLQTVDDFETIVVDDASTDNTEQVVVRYRSLFGQRLKYVKLNRRVGRGGVRNFGLARSTSPYIAFLDADDVYCGRKLEVQSNYLDEHPMVGGVSCQCYTANAALEVQGVLTGKESTLKMLLGSHYAYFVESTVAVMYRRELINEVGEFDDTIERGQDLDLLIRAARRRQIDFIREPLWIYRLHGTNSGSMQGLSERTYSNIVLYRKIIASEHPCRAGAAKRYAAANLKSHVYRIRERKYGYSVRVWFLYLSKMNLDLPLIEWSLLGVKVLVGYRLTQSAKRLIGFVNVMAARTKRLRLTR